MIGASAIPESPAARPMDVAVAVLTRPDGTFLLARRPQGKPYAGYWEFPGGKVEPGEAVAQALAREIREELGTCVEQAYPWITQVFRYPHATVKLHFYRVVQWRGEPHPHEGQELSWQPPERVQVAPLLPANAPVLRALRLPPVLGISNAAELGAGPFMVRLEAALERGLRLVQVREKEMVPEQLARFARDVTELAHRYGAKVTVNADPELAQAAGADGVHLTADRLARLKRRPDLGLCGASCHRRDELERAADLGLDYALLGPVLPTLSHPGAAAMGWPVFAETLKDLPLPVYGLGGLAAADLETAWRHGAHGIAMLRGAWRG